MTEGATIPYGGAFSWEQCQPVGEVRYIVRNGAPVLQQSFQVRWFDGASGGVRLEWRDVPTEIEP